jgi:hypothetical protein
MLPITKTAVEAAPFDIQKIQNPGMPGAECRQGDRLGSGNAGVCVLFRDGLACHGGEDCKSHASVVRRIEARRIGGGAPNILLALCKDCRGGYRDAAFMGVMRES